MTTSHHTQFPILFAIVLIASVVILPHCERFGSERPTIYSNVRIAVGNWQGIVYTSPGGEDLEVAIFIDSVPHVITNDPTVSEPARPYVIYDTNPRELSVVGKKVRLERGEMYLLSKAGITKGELTQQMRNQLPTLRSRVSQEVAIQIQRAFQDTASNLSH